MDVEIAVLELNHTWDIVDLHLEKKVVGSKWVYRIKYHSNGSIE